MSGFHWVFAGNRYLKLACRCRMLRQIWICLQNKRVCSTSKVIELVPSAPYGILKCSISAPKVSERSEPSERSEHSEHSQHSEHFAHSEYLAAIDWSASYAKSYILAPSAPRRSAHPVAGALGDVCYRSWWNLTHWGYLRCRVRWCINITPCHTMSTWT